MFDLSLHETCSSPMSVESVFPTRGPELGGTTISLSVRGYIPNLPLCCRFGEDVQVSTTLSYPFIEPYLFLLSCVSPEYMPGKVDVSVICCEDNSPTLSLGVFSFIYEYSMALSIVSIQPAFGSKEGSTRLKVRGTNFQDVNELKCSFGGIIVDAVFISPDSLYCFSPPFPILGEVSIEISINANDFEGSYSSLKFMYTEIPTIQSVHPQIVPISGGFTLSVVGINFPIFAPRTNVFCKIGPRIGYGKILDGANMICQFHHNEVEINERFGLFSLTFNGIDWLVMSGTYIDVLPQPELVHIQPDVGPDTGNTTVYLTGKHLHRSMNLFCQFGTFLYSDATFISSSLVKCQTPQNIPGSILDVLLTSKSGLWNSNSLTFRYAERITITSNYPLIGSWFGRTPINIYGTGFKIGMKYAYCDFMEHGKSKLEVLNQSLAICHSPPMENKIASNVELSISIEGEYINSTMLSFRYVSPPIVEHITPSTGPLSGGTIVSVYGKWSYVLDSEIICIFGSKISAVHRVSDSVIICVSPAFVGPTQNVENLNFTVPFSLNVDGVNSTPNKLLYAYYQPIEINEIIPLYGGKDGGSTVTLSGSNFHLSIPKYCIFGAKIVPIRQRLSSSTVICETPSFEEDSRDIFEVPIGVSINGKDFQFYSSNYTFQPHPQIVNIDPRLASVEGGTLVRLLGKNFFWEGNSSSKYCAIGKNLVTATIENSTSIICSIPPSFRPGVFDISLSLNDGRDFVSSPVSFTYVPGVVVSDFYPRYVTSLGGTVVTVVGKHFMKGDVICLIGNIPIEVSVIDDTILTFISPPIPHNEGMHVVVYFSINSGAEYGTETIMLKVIHPPCISKAIPPFSTELGGSSISIEAEYLDDKDDLYCVFSGGIHGVKAKRLIFDPLGTARCESPEWQSVPDLVKLSLSSTMNYYSSDCNVDFDVKPALTLTSIQPHTGPTNGGTNVTVTGSGFKSEEDQYWCLFGRAKVHASIATVVSDQYLHCHSSPSFLNMSQVVSFRLGLLHDDSMFSLESFGGDLQFKYFDFDMNLSITPSIVSLTGKSEVFVKGDTIPNILDLSCLFHCRNLEVVVPAKRYSHSVVSCTSPKFNETALDGKNVLPVVLVLTSREIDMNVEKVRIVNEPIF